MPRTRVMLIGALPVGINNRMPTYPAGGQGPLWRNNFITSEATVTQVPQNLMRVTADGPPFRQSSIGEPAVPLEAHMLGRLGSVRGFSERQAEFDSMVANSDPRYVAYMGTLVTVLAVGQRLMGASVGAYHGYKRNRGKMLPTVLWGVAGAALPVLTVGVGLVQGLAQPKR